MEYLSIVEAKNVQIGDELQLNQRINGVVTTLSKEIVIRPEDYVIVNQRKETDTDHIIFEVMLLEDMIRQKKGRTTYIWMLHSD